MKVSRIEVELLGLLGDDLTVVNAARVSMAKQSAELTDKDTGLLRYLAKNNHWTPFGHVQLRYWVKAPVYVARQYFRSTVGVVRNEVSRRYVDDEPEFHFPEVWRARAPSVKQGSAPHEIADARAVELLFHETCAASLRAYESALARGLAPELARTILPVNMMTEWVETASLAALARICGLRLDPHAQKEIQDLAAMLADMVPGKVQHSWNALMTLHPETHINK